MLEFVRYTNFVIIIIIIIITIRPTIDLSDLYLFMTSHSHVPTTDNWAHLVFVKCFLGAYKLLAVRTSDIKKTARGRN